MRICICTFRRFGRIIHQWSGRFGSVQSLRKSLAHAYWVKLPASNRIPRSDDGSCSAPIRPKWSTPAGACVLRGDGWCCEAKQATLQGRHARKAGFLGGGWGWNCGGVFLHQWVDPSFFFFVCVFFSSWMLGRSYRSPLKARFNRRAKCRYSSRCERSLHVVTLPATNETLATLPPFCWEIKSNGDQSVFQW